MDSGLFPSYIQYVYKMGVFPTVCQRLCARNRLAPDDLRKVTKPHRKMSICSFLTRWFFSVDETNQISLFTELEGVKSSQQ